MYKGLKIALMGKMRSGKDTVASIMIEKYLFKRYAFADGIWEICQMLYPDKMIAGKNRALGQCIATDLRKHDENVWLNYLKSKIANDIALERNVVVTDLRFPNEYKYLKAIGFRMVKVHASFDNRIKRIIESGDNFKTENLTHESEQHIEGFDFDYIINNDNALDVLQLETIKMIETFCK